MKKTIFTTLALGTIITFGGLSNDASASEIDYSKLAEQAKNNDITLNQKPILQGDYDYKFTDNHYAYHFWNSNGTFGWEYHLLSQGETETSNEVRQSMVGTGEVVQDAPTQVEQAPTPKQETTIQDNSNVQSTTESAKPEPQQAPKVENTTVKETPKQSTGNGSVKTRFLNAGGTEAMWQHIVMPESTGNPNARNGQYSGLFQMSPQSGNGTGAVEEQTKSAIKYANDRYGSLDNAISERQSKGWW